MGCNYTIKSDGNSSLLSITCGDCFNGVSLENSDECMGDVIEILLQERDVDYIVLKGLVQKEYGKAQTSILNEVIDVYEATREWPSMRLTNGDCDKCEPTRKDNIERCLGKLLKQHPARAYAEFIEYFHAAESRCENADSEECVECEYLYIELLSQIRKIFESNSFFKELHRKGVEVGKNRSIYRELITSTIRPYFTTSRLMLKPPSDAHLVSSYNVGRNIVRIYCPSKKPEYLYFVTPAEYTLSPIKFDVINKARDSMLERRPQSLDFANISSSKTYIKRIAKRAIAEIGGKIDGEEVDELVDILIKHTLGLGVVEILLEDENVRDVYINAPANEAPICLNHGEYEDCVTNIYLTEDDAEALISKFRSRSGRPFSEATPVLDLELPEFNTRVAAIGSPLSPDGLAFALRRQKPTPWTLPQFVSNNTLNSLAAGLLSFLIDGQATILVTGSRGSGKTSLLGSLIGEIKPGLRILTIEDTLEIPVKSFNDIGYRIQRLKVGSSGGGYEVEMTPQAALNTALRLGESVLIIGEVRGPETKVLYESMRIGAAGNSVLGTIHGASTESVFDRVVYDIGIPASSFKATDVVVTVAPIRKEGGLKSFRRVLQISEVTKRWSTQNPDPTEVFRDLMLYEHQSDELLPTENFNHNSELISTIARKWNLTYQQALGNIKLRSKVKNYILNKSSQVMKPKLLELENVVLSNNMLRMLNEEYISEGIVEYARLFEDWKKWFDDYCKTVA
ncbi:MAG: type II/IV secretion system ATPase subunit [Candidatus Hydrothermarchaeales archaeon]